jgi:adenine-specific DNA glycosylase
MREKLLEWYSCNGRDCPWCETRSRLDLDGEVMLQQKQVPAGGVLNVP